MRHYITFMLTLGLGVSLHAQNYFTGHEGNLPEPSPYMSDEERLAYLDSAQADSLVLYDTGFTSGFKLRKEEGWFLYLDGRAINEKPMEFIGPFGEHFYEYALAKQDGKWGFLNYKGQGKLRYDSLKIIEQGLSQEPIVLAQSWGLWTQILPGYPPPIFPFIYEQAEDVPAIAEASYYLDIFDEMRKAIPVDIIVPDPNNGDGIYQVRDKNTKKWGMLQFIGTSADTLIPALYDSLEFYTFNGEITAVWLDGKVGFYGFSERDQLLPCAYDNYRKVRYRRSSHSPSYLHLLVEKDGRWGYVDFGNGEALSNFDASHPDSVAFPSVESSYYHY